MAEPTKEKVLLALEPRVVMAAMHTTMIRASITAYSTAVGPSSRFRNETSFFVRLRIASPRCGNRGVGTGPFKPGGASGAATTIHIAHNSGRGRIIHATGPEPGVLPDRSPDRPIIRPDGRRPLRVAMPGLSARGRRDLLFQPSYRSGWCPMNVIAPPFVLLGLIAVGVSPPGRAFGEPPAKDSGEVKKPPKVTPHPETT